MCSLDRGLLSAPFTSKEQTPALGRTISGRLFEARRTHIPELDGVRALAAALVFLVHFAAAFLKFPGDDLGVVILAALQAIGFLGVEVFFVLSGFLVYGIVASRVQQTREFAVRRVQRVMPMFLVILTIYVAMGIFSPSLAKISLPRDWMLLIANVLLLPGVYQITTIVTVAWSLSFEAHFYGFLALANRLKLPERSFGFRLSLIGTFQIITIILSMKWPWLLDFSFFAIGMLTYELRTLMVKTNKHTAVTSQTALWLLCLGVVARGLISTEMLSALPHLNIRPIFWSIILVAVPLALLIIGTADEQRAHGVFTHPMLRFLGITSYSFYLLHGPTIHAIFFLAEALGFNERPSWFITLLLSVPTYAIAVLVSWVGYELIERPLATMGIKKYGSAKVV